MEEAGEAADEKLLVDEQDDGGEDHLHEAHGHVVPLEPGGDGPAPHMMAHGEVHQDQQKAQRPQEPPLQHWRLPILQRLLLGGMVHLLRRALLPAAVARRLHSLDDLLRGHVPLHAHGVGEQAHRAGGDPLDPVHGLLHPGAAGRAAHARHIVLLHIHSFSAARPPLVAPIVYPWGVYVNPQKRFAGMEERHPSERIGFAIFLLKYSLSCDILIIQNRYYFYFGDAYETDCGPVGGVAVGGVPFLLYGSGDQLHRSGHI